MLKSLAAAAAFSLMGALAPLASGTALAQEVTLRLAHVAPPQTTYQQAAERFKAALQEVSGGTMDVEIIPGGVLGDLGQLWVQNRTGALDLHMIDLAALVAMKEARPFLVMWTPFLFEDQAHLHRFVGSDTFNDMMADVEQQTGVRYMGYLGDRPPRALTTASKAVKTPADLAGLKIRTPEHPMIIGAFKAWGANPTPIKASELFTALKTGLVDGQDNGIIDAVGAGYMDAQKYYMPLDYIHSGLGLWMSPQRFEGLTEEQRGFVREAAKRAGEEGKELHAKQMEEAYGKLAETGSERVEVDRDAFKGARDAIVGNMEGKVWPEGLTETIGKM